MMRHTSGILVVWTTAILTVVAVLTLSAPSSADGLEQRFSGAFPPDGWLLVDYAGDGVEWQRNSAWGDANWTGGAGYCAEVSSAHSPGLGFDAGLISPPFIGPADGLIFFRANYQNFMGTDQFDVIITMGINAFSLLTWTSDHGGFESLPGAGAVVPLPPVMIGQELRLEFRYRDNDAGGDAWYVQIDDVLVGDETAVEQARWGAIKAMYR